MRRIDHNVRKVLEQELADGFDVVDFGETVTVKGVVLLELFWKGGGFWGLLRVGVGFYGGFGGGGGALGPGGWGLLVGLVCAAHTREGLVRVFCLDVRVKRGIAEV